MAAREKWERASEERIDVDEPTLGACGEISILYCVVAVPGRGVWLATHQIGTGSRVYPAAGAYFVVPMASEMALRDPIMVVGSGTATLATLVVYDVGCWPSG